MAADLRSEAGAAFGAIQVIQGRAQIYRTLRQFVGTAKQEVLAFTTTKGLQRSYRAGINEVLVEAMRRGVKPRLAADINESNAALMARVAEKVPLRHVDRQRPGSSSWTASRFSPSSFKTRVRSRGKGKRDCGRTVPIS